MKEFCCDEAEMDYEVMRMNFNLEVPTYSNFARDVIDKWGEDTQKIAMVWVDSEKGEGSSKEIRKPSFETWSGWRWGDIFKTLDH